jgi:hypothetical protein
MSRTPTPSRNPYAPTAAYYYTQKATQRQSALKKTPTKKQRKKICKKQCKIHHGNEFKKCYKSCIDPQVAAAPQALVVRRGTAAAPQAQALVRRGTAADPFRVESIQKNLDVLCVSKESRVMIRDLFKTFNNPYPCKIKAASPASPSRKLIPGFRRRSAQVNIIETIMVKIVHSYFTIIFTVRRDPRTIPAFLDCTYFHMAKALLTDICIFIQYLQQRNMVEAERLLRKMILTVHAVAADPKQQLLPVATSETPPDMCRRLYESLAMIIYYLEHQYQQYQHTATLKKIRGGGSTTQRKKKRVGGGKMMPILLSCGALALFGVGAAMKSSSKKFIDHEIGIVRKGDDALRTPPSPPSVNIAEGDELGLQFDMQAEVQAKAQADAQADAQAKAQADAQADAQAKAQAEAQAEVQAEAQAEAQAEVQAEAQAEAHAEAQAKAQAEAHAEAQAKAQADAQANASYGDQVEEQGQEVVSSILFCIGDGLNLLGF